MAGEGKEDVQREESLGGEGDEESEAGHDREVETKCLLKEERGEGAENGERATKGSESEESTPLVAEESYRHPVSRARSLQGVGAC